MTKDEWIFKRTLRDLEMDVLDCERLLQFGEKPSYDLLGTLRTNLRVSTKFLHAAAPVLVDVHKSLAERARKILGGEDGHQ